MEVNHLFKSFAKSGPEEETFPKNLRLNWTHTN